MQYTQLGHTGLQVSRIALGTTSFGSGRDKGPVFAIVAGVEQKEADTLVAAAIERGINLFDTANTYSSGESEVVLGKALGGKRQDVVLATKVNGRMAEGPNGMGLSRKHIMSQVDASLKRLGTDYIDLYQCHEFDPNTPLEETLRALDDLVRQGKVRYIGCSNFQAWRLMESLAISTAQNLERFACMQAYYSVAGREIEHEIAPFALAKKMGLLIWSPLAGGALSGRINRRDGIPAADRRAQMVFPPVDIDALYDIVDVLEQVAVIHNATVSQVALAWLLHKPHVTSIISGARNLDELSDVAAAVDLKLSADEMKRIDRASRIPRLYPAWLTTAKVFADPKG